MGIVKEIQKKGGVKMENITIALLFIKKMISLWLVPFIILIISALTTQFVLYRFFGINLYKIITKKLF